MSVSRQMAPSKHGYLGSPSVPCAHLLPKWPSGWNPWAPQEPLQKERPREQRVMKAGTKGPQGQAVQGRSEGAGKEVPSGAARPASHTPPQDMGVPSRAPAQEALQSVLVLVGKVTPSDTAVATKGLQTPKACGCGRWFPPEKTAVHTGGQTEKGAGLRRSVEVPHAHTIPPHTSTQAHLHMLIHKSTHI